MTFYMKQFSENKSADCKFVDQYNTWCSGILTLPKVSFKISTHLEV